MTRLRRAVWVLLIILSVIGGDHIAKGMVQAYLPPGTILSMAGDTVRVQYAVNRGAVFNFEDQLPESWQGPPCTVATAVLGSAMILLLLLGPALRVVPMTGLALFTGGMLSNLLDRALLGGSVVDFLRVGWGPFRSDVFNLADVALVTGGVLFLGGLLWRLLRPTAAHKTAGPGPNSSLSR